MKRVVFFRWALGLMLSLLSLPLCAQVPVTETGQLLTFVQKVMAKSQANAQINAQRVQLLQQWHAMLVAINETTTQLNNKVPAWEQGLFNTPQGSYRGMNHTSQPNAQPERDGEGLDGLYYKAGNDPALYEPLEETHISVSDSGIKVFASLKEPPVFQPVSTASFLREMNLRPAVVKVSNAIGGGRLEEMVWGAARALLPQALLDQFAPERAVEWLQHKIGFRQLGEGIFIRKTVAQDALFREFAGLDSSETEHLLFWSDPSVVAGYHPVLGTALNGTALWGFRSVDMDNVLSRGHSGQIDRANRLLPTTQQEPNPYKGYASRVLPGLVVMARRGQLETGEPPSDAELNSAMELSKNLTILPSQCLGEKLKQPASVRGFQFMFPIPVQQTSALNQAVVELAKMDRELHKKTMESAGKRLREIATLRKANRDARGYVTQIIGQYRALAASIGSLGASADGEIPQIPELRAAVLDHLLHYRRALSKLEHQYDVLRHQEWAILQHVVDAKQASIEKLMDNAALRWRIRQAYGVYKTGGRL